MGAADRRQSGNRDGASGRVKAEVAWFGRLSREVDPFPQHQNRLDGPDIWNNRSRDRAVATTFDKVADIISETSEIDRDTITPESHTIDDLGIDSLDFLDIVFAIDKEFGIKIPLERWTQEVNDGKVPTSEYFVMKNLCAKIDELVARKAQA